MTHQFDVLWVVDLLAREDVAIGLREILALVNVFLLSERGHSIK